MDDSQTNPSTFPLESHSSTPKVILSPSEGPPSLDYDIASKRWSIAISSLGIVLINGVTPAVLFYGLKYGTTVSRPTVINVVEVSTTLNLPQWPWRLWQLLRRGGERAPNDRTALTWDTFQWNFLIGVFPVTICCAFAGVKESMRWYMFGPVILFAEAAVQMVLTWFLARAKVSVPFRMSSFPEGKPLRPMLYFLIEDITACDGAGGQAFRNRLDVRWTASPPFRKLIEDLTLYLGLGFLVQTVAQVAILLLTDETVFVAASTLILWGWSGLSASFAIAYTKRALRDEKLWWAERHKEFPECHIEAQMA